MLKRRPLRSFTKDSEGATIVEFAIVAMAFFMLMFGIIEFGMFMMTQVAVESIVSQAGRIAAVKQDVSGCDRVCQTKNFIESKAQNLLNYQNASTVTITSRNLSTGQGSDFAGDLCLSEPPHVGGACSSQWEDLNGNNQYDPGPGFNSVGGPGDLIELRVNYVWRVINPMFKPFFGNNGTISINSTTVVKNES